MSTVVTFLTLMPAATIKTSLNGLSKSFTSWESIASDIFMLGLFLIGILCLARGIYLVTKQQPCGRMFAAAFGAFLISGVFYKHFKDSQRAVSSAASGSVNSALKGNG